PLYTDLPTEEATIRLLTIDPISQSDLGVCGQLSTYPLASIPHYTAISYTWGDPKRAVPIRLNGHQVYVMRNLKQALRRLRSLNLGVPIWVDAICINHADSKERTEQVQLMRQIYETAILTIVYLGEPSQS
ncbi:hypothetical protein EK21DRAFT_12408, partial [Setomelanomma holmii]